MRVRVLNFPSASMAFGEGLIQLSRPPPQPFDIEPPWQAIKEWIPDDEPDFDWFNRPRNPSNPGVLLSILPFSVTKPSLFPASGLPRGFLSGLHLKNNFLEASPRRRMWGGEVQSGSAVEGQNVVVIGKSLATFS